MPGRQWTQLGTSTRYRGTSVNASGGGTCTGKTGEEMVTVEVTNVDEPGLVTLSALQPQAGVTDGLTATDRRLTVQHPTPSGSGRSP